MAKEESTKVSERRIVWALIYGTSPAQANGMLNEFTRAEAEWVEQHGEDRDDGE